MADFKVRNNSISKAYGNTRSSRVHLPSSKTKKENEISPKDSVELSQKGKDSESIGITVLHTNDIHGNVLPYRAKDPHTGKAVKMGGGAYLASKIKQERKEALARGDGVLLLDAGDMAVGTPLSGIFKGKPVIALFNNEKYDAATVGNHDLDWGLPTLSRLVKRARFPFLAANIKDNKGNPLPFLKSYMIKDIKGVKVGIVGVTTPETAYISSNKEISELKFEDPVTTLQKTIPQMKKEGAEVIIVLSHAGFKSDMKIAHRVKGIDLIVGGHSHKDLDQPVMVGKTAIVQAGFGGENVGKVRLSIDPKSHKVISIEGKLIPIRKSKITPDSTAQAIIDGYAKSIEKVMQEPLGKAITYFYHPREGQETNLGNLITDIMRLRTKADFAFLNSGCIKADLSRGRVKYEDVYRTIPFDSKIVVIKMKGKDIKDALELSSQMDRDKKLQISGLRVKYNSKNPIGKRIVHLEADNGKPIEMEKEYTVAITDYLSNGGDRYDIFTKFKPISTEGDLQGEVIRQIKRTHILAPVEVGRIEDIGKMLDGPLFGVNQ